jgi:hydroxymethylpyrimidine pyrophosphatase-like HAD family hydrolase
VKQVKAWLFHIRLLSYLFCYKGLLIYDAEGNRLYERALELDICIEAIKLADQRGEVAQTSEILQVVLSLVEDQVTAGSFRVTSFTGLVCFLSDSSCLNLITA